MFPRRAGAQYFSYQPTVSTLQFAGSARPTGGLIALTVNGNSFAPNNQTVCLLLALSPCIRPSLRSQFCFCCA